MPGTAAAPLDPLAAFAAVAAEFCALIDDRAGLGGGPLLLATHALLPRLYAAALALPAIEADGEGDAGGPEGEAGDEELSLEDVRAGVAAEGRDSLPHDQWRELYHSLAALIGPERLHYAEVFDAYAESPEAPVTGSLADDLADVYRDLADGLAKWRRGEREAALWRWRFYFTFHWGEHVTSALRALHVHAANHGGTFPGAGHAAA